VFRLERHLERLKRSLDTVGIDRPIIPAAIRRSLAELLEANDLRDARIRFTVTGGLFDGNIRLRRTSSPMVFIMAWPLVAPPEEAYVSGITLHVASFRQPWSSLLARIKTTHRLEYLMAREEAIENDADDALILDEHSAT
jgi:branched-chain amino acid aminotransferase